jgi:hypothetical protein
VALGFGVSGGIPQGNSRSFGIFFRGGRQLKWESVFGPLISIRWMGGPPLLPNPSRTPYPLQLLQPPPTLSTPLATLFLSSSFAAALYPLHGFLLPLDLPPRSKDREEEEQVGLKSKRGPRRCSIPISSCRFSWGNPR